MQQPGAKHEVGAGISNGGRAPLTPPLGTALISPRNVPQSLLLSKCLPVF